MFNDRNGADIEGVACFGFIGADATFTQHHIIVAVAENVFSAHQPFFRGAAEAAFEKDGAIGFADGVEQGIVLHITRTNLENVGIFAD